MLFGSAWNTERATGLRLKVTEKVLVQGTSGSILVSHNLLVEHRTRDRKFASSNPGRSGGRIFFSWVNFVCWLLFGVRSTLVLPQWHVKDPGHSAKSADDRLHLNMHTLLTHRSRSGLPMPLSRQSMGIYKETSSHATFQGTIGHSRLSSLSHCGVIRA